MDYQAIVEQVMGRAQFESPAVARRAIEATVHALAQSVAPRVALELSKHMPGELAAVMRHAEGHGAQNANEFYGRIGERAGLSLSRGLEQAQIVCTVLAERLDPSLVGRLSRELPDEIAALLSPAEHVVASGAHAVGHGRTLAEGRPGGSSPLSEARPGSTRPVSEAAPPGPHTHSVFEHETLVEGHGKRS